MSIADRASLQMIGNLLVDEKVGKAVISLSGDIPLRIGHGGFSRRSEESYT